MSDMEEINKAKKSRNVWLIVAMVAAFGAVMRWLGVYGPGAGSIDWITITMFIVAILVVVSKHIQISKLS